MHLVTVNLNPRREEGTVFSDSEAGMLKPSLRFGIVVLAGALVAGACNLDTLFQTPDDQAITTEIQAKLFQDPTLKTRDIKVVSQKGVVVLTGSVSTDFEKQAAERFARQARGVKQVVDDLSVGQPAAADAAPASAPETTKPAMTAHKAEAPQMPAAPARRHAAGKRAGILRAQAAPPAEPSAAAAPAPAEASATPAPTPVPAAQQAATPAPPPPPAPVQITIPAGTVVTVRMIDAIDSSRNRPGEEFAATVDAPLVVGDRVVVPLGSDARVRLVNAASAGHISGRSELELELIAIGVGGQTYRVESGYYEQHGASRGKRTAETVGGGAVLGALIGAIAGHGKGAAIGSAVGAGAGTAVQVATKGPQVKVTSESKLDFTLKSSVTITQ